MLDHRLERAGRSKLVTWKSLRVDRSNTWVLAAFPKQAVRAEILVE